MLRPSFRVGDWSGVGSRGHVSCHYQLFLFVFLAAANRAQHAAHNFSWGQLFSAHFASDLNGEAMVFRTTLTESIAGMSKSPCKGCVMMSDSDSVTSQNKPVAVAGVRGIGKKNSSRGESVSLNG